VVFKEIIVLLIVTISVGSNSIKATIETILHTAQNTITH